MRSKSFSRSPFLEAARSMDIRTLLSLLFHLPNFIRLFIRLLRDPRVPYHLKLFVYAAILYWFFPLDVIRDFPFLGIGYLDDVVLLFLALRALVRGSPPEVVREHVEAISGHRGEGGERMWDNAERETSDREGGGPPEPKNVTPPSEHQQHSGMM